MRPSTLFFGCKTPEKSTRKTGFEVCRWSTFRLGKKHALEGELTKLSLAFIDCIQAAFKLQVKSLLTWVQKDKQIYIQMCKHTHTLFGKQSQETRRAPTAGRDFLSIIESMQGAWS